VSECCFGPRRLRTSHQARGETREAVLDKSDEPLFIRHDRVPQKLYPITIKTVWKVVMAAVKGL
jgi:hypothetical protein